MKSNINKSTKTFILPSNPTAIIETTIEEHGDTEMAPTRERLDNDHDKKMSKQKISFRSSGRADDTPKPKPEEKEKEQSDAPIQQGTTAWESNSTVGPGAVHVPGSGSFRIANREPAPFVPDADVFRVPDAYPVPMDIENSSVQEKEVLKYKRRIILVVLFFLFVIVILVGGLVGGLLNRNTTTTTNDIPSLAPSTSNVPSQAPSTRFQGSFQSRLIELIQSLSPATSFENPSSPQSLALDWMVTRDEFSQPLLFNSNDHLVQRFVLVTLWYATGGPTNWNDDGRGWLNKTSAECDWNSRNFLSFTSNGLVTDLDLSQVDLIGTIPIELGLLTSLERLNFIKNQLMGTIPTELGLLTALQFLDFDSNRCTGTIPTELSRLTLLTKLSLDRNGQLTGTIPTNFGLLTALSFLDLDANLLTGTIPTELGLLTALEFLYLDRNRLMGPIPTEVGRLTLLTIVHLDNNQLSGSLPTELASLTNLNEFMLFNNDNLGGVLPSTLCNNNNNGMDALPPRIDCVNIDCECCVDNSGTSACP